MGLSDVTDALACPVCAAAVHFEQHSLACASGHRFDIAREGYVNLLPGGAKPSTADTPEMVSARVAFLAAGHYDPLIRAVTDAVTAHVADAPGPILDAGGGTGEYLASVLEALPDRKGISLDLSRAACKVAARALPDAGVAVTDVWTRLPLLDSGVSAVLDVFAPRNAAEFSRVLHPSGFLLVVTPTGEHLRELVDAIGLITVDPDKEARLAEALDGHFRHHSTRLVNSPLVLSRTEVHAAVMMGPSAAHIPAEDLTERIRHLEEPVSTKLAARVSVYRPIGTD